MGSGLVLGHTCLSSASSWPWHEIDKFNIRLVLFSADFQSSASFFVELPNSKYLRGMFTWNSHVVSKLFLVRLRWPVNTWRQGTLVKCKMLGEPYKNFQFSLFPKRVWNRRERKYKGITYGKRRMILFSSERKNNLCNVSPLFCFVFVFCGRARISKLKTRQRWPVGSSSIDRKTKWLFSDLSRRISRSRWWKNRVLVFASTTLHK